MKLNKMTLDLIKADIKAHVIPFLIGPGGIGKTYSLNQIAKQLHTKCFVVSCNQMADRTDLLGVRQGQLPDGTPTQEFYPMRTIQEAIDHAKANPTSVTILFLDELNRAPRDVISGMLAMSSERRIADQKIPANLAIVVAGNDKGHVVTLDAPSISRYHLIHVEPDTASFLAYNAKTLNPYIKTVLENEPDLIYCEPRRITDTDDDTVIGVEEELDLEEEMRPYTCPRSIGMLSRVLDEIDDDTLRTMMTTNVTADGESKTLLEEVMEGLVGETDFERHLNMEITKGLNSASTQNLRYQVPKPLIWETLVSKASIAELEDFVNHSMSASDVTGCFVYAMADKVNRRDVINALVSRMDAELIRNNGMFDTIFDVSDMRTLVDVASADMLNPTNINTFRETNSNLWSSLYAVFAPYVD